MPTVLSTYVANALLVSPEKYHINIETYITYLLSTCTHTLDQYQPVPNYFIGHPPITLFRFAQKLLTMSLILLEF